MWTFPHKKADTLLREYLKWAQEERKQRHFVEPPDARSAVLGFARLAAPPMQWNRRSSRISAPKVKRYGGIGNEGTSHSFWGWESLALEDDGSMIDVPLHMYDRFDSISEEFSRSSVPTQEAPGGDEIQPSNYSETRFIRPFGAAGSPIVWLKTSAIDPRSLQACRNLFRFVSEQLCKIGYSYAYWDQIDNRANWFKKMKGRWRLERALSDILARGLVQGLEAFCELEFKRPKRLVWWLVPVIEVDGIEGQLNDIRICWVPRQPLKAQPCTNLRKRRPSLQDEKHAHDNPRKCASETHLVGENL